MTVRRLMLLVLLSGLCLWGGERLWNWEYTGTAFVWTYPAGRATYTRTYRNWILERMGLAEIEQRNWKAIPGPDFTPGQGGFPGMPVQLPNTTTWSFQRS
jgi:hypothetical protein